MKIKRNLSIMLAVFCAFSVIGCGCSDNSEDIPQQQSVNSAQSSQYNDNSSDEHSKTEQASENAVDGFTYNETNDGTIRIMGYSGSDTAVIIPSKIKGKPVTSIYSYAFSDCEKVVSITIPDSIESIGMDAFKNTAWYASQPDGIVYIGEFVYKYKGNMPKNTEITLKDSTKGISDGAFNKCGGLTSITISDSVKVIGSYAFDSCTGLKSITIPEGVTEIGNSAFNGCTNLSNITIPDSVTTVGSYAFYNTPWHDLQPDGLVYVGKAAYEYKGEMPKDCKIVLKDGTKSINKGAFARCENLTGITIPDSVTRIGYYAFFNCTGLAKITIPKNVTYIGEYAFKGCSGLTICGYKGSCAETYAKENNITFEAQ